MNQTAAGSAPLSINQTKAPTRTRRRLRLLPYALVLPIVLYEGLLLIYPIAQGIYGSFTRIELAGGNAPTWIGLNNYTRMLSDPAFWKVMQTTMTFTGLVIVVALSVGLLTALL